MKFLQKKNLAIICLIAIIIFSIIIRFWFFWDGNFSGDESAHAMKAISVGIGIKDLITIKNTQIALHNVFDPIMSHAHPPLEFLIVVPFVIFQPREFFVRLPFILVNLVTLILGCVLVGKKQNKIKTISFLIFFGTSLYVVWWSQTAMYQSLAISVGFFISLSFIKLSKQPTKKILFTNSVLLGIGLMVFSDFFLYIPVFLFILYEKRSYFSKNDMLFALTIFILICGPFYLTWIIYGFLPGTEKIGFNYFIHNKFSGQINIFRNTESYARNFFLFPGVFVLFPAVIYSLFKKTRESKYLIPVFLSYYIIYVLKPTAPYFYFCAVFGPLCLIAISGISKMKKRHALILLILTLLVNIFTLSPIFNRQFNGLIFFDTNPKDRVKYFGDIIKRCTLQDNETYLSTSDPWRTNYYFGRPSLYESENFTGVKKKLKLFLSKKDNYINLTVKFIHFQNGLLDDNLQSELEKKALKILFFGNEKLLLFRDCNIQK